MVYEKVTLPVARKIAGMTQVDLAKTLNVSEATVINWEKGRSEPTVIQAIQIAEAVNRPLDSIVFLPKSAV